MDALNLLLLFLVRLGLIFVAVVFVARWFLVFLIWFKYDYPILKLKTDFDNFRKQQRKRVVAQPFIDGSINHRAKEVNEQLEILETKRRLLLDRVNLFLSISSISNKY